MVQESRPWAGNILTGSPGDAGPYTDNDWDDIWEVLYGSGASGGAPYGNRGVIRNWLNELEVTDPVIAQRVDVGTGAALVHGKFYRNTALVSITAIPVPGGGAGHTWREDTIFLRSVWGATQTIRIYRHQNPADEALYDTPASIDGTVWYIPLAAVRINAAGAITLITDLREYVSDLMQPKQIQVRPRITADGGADAKASGHHGIQLTTIGDECYFEFMVPLDFKEKTAGYVRFIAGPGGTIDWTVLMYAGGCGELGNAVSDSATADGLAVTNNIITCLDISSALDGLEAGDEVGVAFRLDAKVTVVDIFVLMLDFRYR